MRAPLLLALLLQATGALAQATGSTAFCLFPVPADGGIQRWINLGIVQYVEARNDDVRIYYGGGNLGSGHEARIPVTRAAGRSRMGMCSRCNRTKARPRPICSTIRATRCA